MSTLNSYILAAIFSISFASPCLPGDSNSGPVTKCQKPWQQCRFEDGQVGVCHDKTDGKLVCTEQQ